MGDLQRKRVPGLEPVRAARPLPGEERFRSLVEQIPAIVYVEIDDEPRTTYISPRIQDVLGYPPQRFLVEDDIWSTIVHPDDHAGARTADARAGATREPYAAEYRLRDVDGNYHWFHDEAVFLVDGSGLGYWQGVMLEIGEQKRIELELRETAAKLRTLLEQIPAVVYIEGAEGSADSPYFISGRYEELFGYTVEERLADPGLWIKLLHPEDRDRAVRAATLAAQNGEPFSEDYRMVARDGRVVWVHDETVLVRDELGGPLFWQGVLFDITERKRGEQELRQALELERRAVDHLRQADEMKSAFLTAVSHDVRAPLAAILGSAVTLEKEEELRLSAEDRRALVRGLAGKARRLTTLVSNLLDSERISHGVLDPRRSLVDVGEIVTRILSETDLLDQRTLHVDVEPSPADVDASMVERIVENLLANAAKHTPPGSSVWVRVDPDPGGVLLAVEDDGPGVPADLRDNVFLAYERGSETHTPGVGLGLSLVKRFAELHGGRAWVEERPGGGASFRVLLGIQPR